MAGLGGRLEAPQSQGANGQPQVRWKESDRFFLGRREKRPKKAGKKGSKGPGGGLGKGKGQDAGSRHLAGGGALPSPGKRSHSGRQ